jgi:hypothetical protein
MSMGQKWSTAVTFVPWSPRCKHHSLLSTSIAHVCLYPMLAVRHLPGTCCIDMASSKFPHHSLADPSTAQAKPWFSPCHRLKCNHPPLSPAATRRGVAHVAFGRRPQHHRAFRFIAQEWCAPSEMAWWVGAAVTMQGGGVTMPELVCGLGKDFFLYFFLFLNAWLIQRSRLIA